MMRVGISVSRLLAATLVKEMAWCPAIPWIVANYGIEPPLTPSMEMGIEHHRTVDREELAERLGLPTPRMYQVYLEDPRLGIYGVIDIVAGNRRRLFIAELKAFRTRRIQHFEAQLYTYALLANRRLGAVHQALLCTRDRVRRYDVDLYVLRKAMGYVEKLWRIVTSPEPPMVSQDPRKCAYCRYRKLCPVNEASA